MFEIYDTIQYQVTLRVTLFETDQFRSCFVANERLKTDTNKSFINSSLCVVLVSIIRNYYTNTQTIKVSTYRNTYRSHNSTTQNQHYMISV